MTFPPFPTICLGESSSLACYLSFAGVKRNQITRKHTNIKYASTSTQTQTKAQWSQTEYKVISTHWPLGTRSFWKCHFETYFYGWRQEHHNWTWVGTCMSLRISLWAGKSTFDNGRGNCLVLSGKNTLTMLIQYIYIIYINHLITSWEWVNTFLQRPKWWDSRYNNCNTDNVDF